MAHCYDCAHSALIRSGSGRCVFCFFLDKETTATGVCQAWETRERQSVGAALPHHVLVKSGVESQFETDSR